MPQSKQSPTKRMVFWPHPDQEEVITAALNLAEETAGTKFQTVALEYICQNYLGAGLQFSDPKQALLYARNHSDDPALFAQNWIGVIEALCPELTINAEITLKEHAAA